MPSPAFSFDVWQAAVSALEPMRRELACQLLIWCSLDLRATPYHRRSAREGAADRQTIFKHPRTGLNFLVLTVTRPDGELDFGLRLDFFDADETVQASFGHANRAPRTQWTKKGERRIFVPPRTELSEVQSFIESMLGVAHKGSASAS